MPRIAPLCPSPRGRHEPWRVLVLLLALLALLACGCAAEPPEVGRTARVERGTLQRIVVATGTVEPENEVEVRPRVPGIIEKVLVEAGDVVKAGDVLVRIERDLLAAQVREAEAQLEAAEVELRYARRALDRVEEMGRNDATSLQNRDDARARHEGAAAAVVRAEARLENLRTQLGYATVVSPAKARVLDVPAEEGSAVSPVTAVTGGTLLLTLAGTDRLHLEGLVDENEIARVAVGQVARIRAEAYPERVFAGRVERIAPIGERRQNVTYFEVEIAIEDEEAALLKPRMSGDADIITATVPDTLFIPETALRYRGAELFAERVSRVGGDAPPVVEEVVLEIGIVDGARVEVLSGLALDDEVRVR